MKILIIANPYDERTGVGIPNSDFEWLCNILSEVGCVPRLIKASTASYIQKVLDDGKPDIVFSAAYDAKGMSGQKNTIIHQLLDTFGIPYIGSSPETLELVLSKYKLKRCLLDAGIATPDFCLFRSGIFLDPAGERAVLPSHFPYILKPCREGNSRGISEDSIVWDERSMLIQLEGMSKYYSEILIEEYLGRDEELREFTIAMIGNERHRFILPVEIKMLSKHPHRLITTVDKTHHKTLAIPVDEPGLTRRISRLAEEVFDIIEARDYARCDMLYANGKLEVIEVNGQPMIPDMWFDACAQTIGMNRRDYCLAIFYAGLKRYIKVNASSLVIPNKLEGDLRSWR
jgi:D-alanine-D-alanine ligase-like ATP-grasp enzyme